VITIPCPNGCGPIEASIFRNHLKNCAPQRRAPEPVDVADDNDLHPRTAYEQRISAENFRRGIAPAPVKRDDAYYEQRNRARKVERFVGAFYEAARAAGADTTSRAVLEEMLRQVESATEEQWKVVAAHIHQNPPSAESRKLIADHFRFQVKRFSDADNGLRDVLEGLHEMRGEALP
jgi:hypothetical protein